ncbi:MAG: DUF1616 domain-containing protein [Chloroflexi bacterium]|nr:DUF1616 domain-containing protein [Chloroflexota bacterium]
METALRQRAVSIPLSWTLLAAVLADLAATAFALVPTLQNSPVRLIFAGLSTFFIHGYLLIACLFPEGRSLETLIRVGLSIAGSLALIILMTLLLSYTPIATSARGELYTLNGVSVLLLAIALFRISRLPPEEALSYSIPLSPPNVRDPYIALSGLGLVAAIVLGIVAITVGRTHESTSLSLATGANVAESVLPASVSVIVTSHEPDPTTFALAVEKGDRTIGTSNPFTLAKDQRKSVTIHFPSLTVTEPVSLVVILTRNGSTAPYRMLRVWERSIPYHPQP